MHCKEESVSGFIAPGSPRVSGVLLPPSPTRGGGGAQSPALQATAILVLDTFPSHPNPPPPSRSPPPAGTRIAVLWLIAVCVWADVRPSV